jgi:hypothetical protein
MPLCHTVARYVSANDAQISWLQCITDVRIIDSYSLSVLQDVVTAHTCNNIHLHSMNPADKSRNCSCFVHLLKSQTRHHSFRKSSSAQTAFKCRSSSSNELCSVLNGFNANRSTGGSVNC